MKNFSFILALFATSSLAYAQTITPASTPPGSPSGSLQSNAGNGQFSGGVPNVTNGGASLTTSQAQATGGSVSIPLASISGLTVGDVLVGTSVPNADQITAITGAAQVTRAANGSFTSGQKVIPFASTTGIVAGMQVTDVTSPSTVGAGNLIASVSANVSITLTSNTTAASSGAADSIQIDPVVTLATTTSAAVASAASLTDYPGGSSYAAPGQLNLLGGFYAGGLSTIGGIHLFNRVIGSSSTACSLNLDGNNIGICGNTNNNALELGQLSATGYAAIGVFGASGGERGAFGYGQAGSLGEFANSMYFASNNGSGADIRFFSNDGSGCTLCILYATGEVGVYNNSASQASPYGTKVFYIDRPTGNFTSIGTGTIGLARLNADTSAFTPGTDPGDSNRELILKPTTASRPSTLSLKDGSNHAWDFTNSGSSGVSLYGSYYNGATYTTEFIIDTSGDLDLTGALTTHNGKALIDATGTGQTGKQGNVLTGWYNTGGAYTSGDPGDPLRGLNIRQNTSGYAAVLSLVNAADSQNEGEFIYQDGSGAAVGKMFLGFRQNATYFNPFTFDSAGNLTRTGAEIATGTAPTLTGTCTTGSQAGGNTAGKFTATCAAQTVIITFATTAPNGWTCNAHDLTTPADALNQTAYATTSCTLTGTTVAADVVTFNAVAW